jgi:hypothetical protein
LREKNYSLKALVNLKSAQPMDHKAYGQINIAAQIVMFAKSINKKLAISFKHSDPGKHGFSAKNFAIEPLIANGK